MNDYVHNGDVDKDNDNVDDDNYYYEKSIVNSESIEDEVDLKK